MRATHYDLGEIDLQYSLWVYVFAKPLKGQKLRDMCAFL